MLIATALSLPGKVFTLQSIKSRIETPNQSKHQEHLKCVFTLQSIKSRIETEYASVPRPRLWGFYSTVH